MRRSRISTMCWSLRGLIEAHAACTNSGKAKRILENFSEYLPKFKKILPHDYRRMMNAIVQMEGKGTKQRAGPDRGVLCQCAGVGRAYSARRRERFAARQTSRRKENG